MLPWLPSAVSRVGAGCPFPNWTGGSANLNGTLAFLEMRGEPGPQKKPREVLIPLRVGRSTVEAYKAAGRGSDPHGRRAGKARRIIPAMQKIPCFLDVSFT